MRTLIQASVHQFLPPPPVFIIHRDNAIILWAAIYYTTYLKYGALRLTHSAQRTAKYGQSYTSWSLSALPSVPPTHPH